MNLALWIVAVLLAAVFLVAAVNKLILPKEKLAAAPGGAWVEDFSPARSRPSELSRSWVWWACSCPPRSDIAPVLVPLAAVGLAW
jgi:hypothetical protein